MSKRWRSSIPGTGSAHHRREVSPDNKVSFIPWGIRPVELLESVEPDGRSPAILKKEERGSTISPWKWTTSRKPSKN